MERVVYDRMRALELTHWWFVARRAILTRLLGDLPLPPRARVLEAGCGVGGNLEMLRRFGEVEAMEPDAESRAYVAERYGLTPSDGRLPDGLPYAPASFDLVCALDVVEHVDDDRAALAALAGLLKPGGHLVITVPAYRWMWSRHDELHHHQRRYTRGEVAALLRAAELTPVKLSYFNTLLFPLAATLRLGARLLGRHAGGDELPPRPLNALLTRVFALEGALLRRANLPFGLSIVAVGRR